jgi:hypothetical protein
MPSDTEYLPLEPLREWIERKIPEYADEDFVPAVEGGKSSGSARLAEAMGISKRLLYRWRGLDTGPDGRRVIERGVGREAIEDALDREGSTFMWELYPDLDDGVDEIHDRYCPKCDEQVTVGRDGVCPWCEAADAPALATARGGETT